MKALRLYARLGLLSPVHVDEANGYRWYRSSQLATARLIGLLRRLDMPLSQVAEVIAAVGPDVDELERALQPEQTSARSKAAQLVAAYWDSVEQRVAAQRLLAAHLQTRLSGSEGNVLNMFSVRERDVAEQTVLTEQRHVLQGDLKKWLPDAIGRLVQLAFEQYGGVADPVFVIYHGEVNNDSDGPVEVCVPISAEAARAGDAMRKEPQHREAFTRITKAQFEFPQILSAYDAVTQWLTTNGKSMTGAPREVYFTDFMGAGPTDEVADIAFPMQ
ncbi:MAG: MerR family transcriptional regulator [Chloroflexi bacterium]|nr:MerR family transcriptional regulator [Chloroflexota bacterium]MBV9133461.1 MerR family transcriptional regulator [Chloroflexota bacterium]